MNTDNYLSLIWEGCLRNERKYQELFYKLLAPKMMAVCMRYAKDKDTAQDILQDGFLKLFKNKHHYRGEGSPCGPHRARASFFGELQFELVCL